MGASAGTPRAAGAGTCAPTHPTCRSAAARRLLRGFVRLRTRCSCCGSHGPTPDGRGGVCGRPACGRTRGVWRGRGGSPRWQRSSSSQARRPRPPRLPPSAVRVPGRRSRWPAGPEVAADRWAGPHPAAALARIRPRRNPCCGNRLLLLRSFPFSVPLPDPTCRLVRPAKRGPGGSGSHVTDVSRDSA